jgi:hypothetical protein
MIIEDEQPFAFGEKPSFRKFMSKACPQFQLPSRRTCTRDIVRHYFEEKAKLKFFKDSCHRVCLTTDCWTSQVQDGYMTVTARFMFGCSFTWSNERDQPTLERLDRALASVD